MAIEPKTSPLALGDIAEKVASGERLSHADGVRLFASREVHEIGRLADLVRRRLHGDEAYYNVNRHINYTNYCVLRCRFCSSFRALPKGGHTPPSSGTIETDAYELSVERLTDLAKAAYADGATEVHIVGGLHPTLPFSYYTDLCRSIRAACPDIHIKAFTAIEIIHLGRIASPRMTIAAVLEALREAGLDSLPGGGAEIFDDRVHKEAYRSKVGEEGWFDVHRTAHGLGIPSNATMLYGHVETPAERVSHMLKLRDHQDVSLRGGGAAFNCFVPLSFIPEDSELSHLPGPTGLDDLKTLAVSRLMLDNFPHIKAFWIMHSPKLAQVSLNWGVDDIDGTVVHYDITRREGIGGSRHQELTINQLRRLIAEAGFEPVERDSLYRRVIRENGVWAVETEARIGGAPGASPTHWDSRAG